MLGYIKRKLFGSKKVESKKSETTKSLPKPSNEIQAMIDDCIQNPDAWSLDAERSGNSHELIRRGKDIEIQAHKRASAPYNSYHSSEWMFWINKPNLGRVIDWGDEIGVAKLLKTLAERRMDKLNKLKLENDVKAREEIVSILQGNPVPLKKKILLIDMDGVIASYYCGFLKEWGKTHPSRYHIPAEELVTFYLEECYEPEWEQDILAITRARGFFLNLPPIPGAVEALEEIWNSEEYEPFLCTSPDVDCQGQTCPTEKYQWVEKHLGRKWLKRMILTNDKTLIKGDILIDDKPYIKGVNSNPSWERVFFTHAYNKNQEGLRIDKWSEWKQVLGNLK